MIKCCFCGDVMELNPLQMEIFKQNVSRYIDSTMCNECYDEKKWIPELEIDTQNDFIMADPRNH